MPRRGAAAGPGPPGDGLSGDIERPPWVGSYAILLDAVKDEEGRTRAGPGSTPACGSRDGLSRRSSRATLGAVKQRAIILSIDGFAAFYWRDPQARLPTLRRLAARGVVAPGLE